MENKSWLGNRSCYDGAQIRATWMVGYDNPGVLHD